MKQFVIIVFTIFSCWFVSCSDDPEQASKIELSSVINITEFLGKYSLQQITTSEELKDADFALITYFKTENTINTHVYPPVVTSGAFAIPVDKLKTNLAILADDTLKSTSPLLYPGYFLTSDTWSLEKHNYGIENVWQISDNGVHYNIPTKLQSSVYRVLLSNYDTMNLNQNLDIRWARASVPNPNNKVYISFKWYPSFNDTQAYKDFPGFETTDAGLYSLTIPNIQALNIPEYGVFQVNVMRYNKELVQVLGRKFFVVNIAESYSSVYIRK